MVGLLAGAVVGGAAYREVTPAPQGGDREDRSERMASKLGNITFYADDPRTLAHFWAGVFGYPLADWEEPLEELSSSRPV